MANRRFLIADPDEARKEDLMNGVARLISGAEFFSASDGTEVLFKLTNAHFDVIVLADRLEKRDPFQLAEWVLRNQKLSQMAIVLLCDVPEEEKFVDEVVTGRVQFLPDVRDQQHLEKVVARAVNYVACGEKTEFHLRFLPADERLMKEGDKADNVYLVKKGRLKAVHKTPDKETVLGQVEVGEFVGEMAYINGEPRSADVIAETACELIEIPVEHLDHILFQRPSWAKALMRTLSKRLKMANRAKASETP